VPAPPGRAQASRASQLRLAGTARRMDQTPNSNSHDGLATESHDEPDRGSRRGLLRNIAIGSAGIIAGTAAVSRPVSASQHPLILGDDNDVDGLTSVNYTGNVPLQNDAFEGTSLISIGDDPPSAADGNNVFPGAIGGYGKGNVPNGVHGSTVNPIGFGVIAANLAPPPGANGTVPKGLGVAAANGSQLYFARFEDAVAGPTPGNHQPGEMYLDRDSVLWFSVASPDGVRWVTLASPAASGAYHPISPARAYDSRQPGYAVTGRLSRMESRVVSVADGHSPGGDVTVSDVVPAGASAVMVNLTAADPTEQNYLSVAEGSATSTATSALNWDSATTQIANALVVPLDGNRQVRVFCGDQPGAVHFIVDVFGYYL
jgi:hypothetical protein